MNIHLCSLVDRKIQYPKITVISGLIYKFNSIMHMEEQKTKNKEYSEESDERKREW